MKIMSCLCCALCIFNAFSAENSGDTDDEAADDAGKPKVVKPSGENNSIEPTVYVDISKSAERDAVSFDGVRAMFGIGIGCLHAGSSVEGDAACTNINMTLLELHLGIEYSKSFKKNFLLSVGIGTDIGKKKKKSGSWADLNEAYEAQRGGVYPAARTGVFEKGSLTPLVALKCGYVIPSLESVFFLKVTFSKSNGKRTYCSGGGEICSIEEKRFAPGVGLGFERKFNNKYGASLEAVFDIEKKTKKVADQVKHVGKLGCTCIRLIGIYSVLDNK
jgi:hypothetical protein